jgi:hypothetical protein
VFLSQADRFYCSFNTIAGLVFIIHRVAFIQNDVSETGLSLRSQVKSLLVWAQSIQLVPVFGYQHQHKVGSINQTT